MIAYGAIPLACAAQTRHEINADTADHEIEFYSAIGAGHTPAFSSQNVTGEMNWSAGVRFGWIITDRPNNGFLSRRFEYAVAFLPLFANFQMNGVGHGVEFDPAVLKWNFTPHHEVQPYVEVSFGFLGTNIPIPPDSSRFNFAPSGGVGIRILRGKYNWSAGIRYMHFSNANTQFNNPGDDSIGIRIAFSRWLK